MIPIEKKIVDAQNVKLLTHWKPLYDTKYIDDTFPKLYKFTTNDTN